MTHNQADPTVPCWWRFEHIITGEQLHEMVQGCYTGSRALRQTFKKNLYEVRPDAPPASELGKALPLLLLVRVTPANLPSKLQLATNMVAAAGEQQQGLGVMTCGAAEAAAAVLPAAALQGCDPDSLEQFMCGSCCLGADGLEGEGGADGDVLVLQLHEAAAAAPQLPGFSVVITARDGQPLSPGSVEPLSVQLMRWQPPTQQQQQVDGALEDHGGSSWQAVPGSCIQVPAELRYTAGAEQQGEEEEEEGGFGAAGSAVTVYDVGALELPTEAGVYKVTASYSTPAQHGGDAAAGVPVVHPLGIGPFLLLPARPSRLVRASTASQQQQQQQASLPQGALPSPRSRGLQGRRGKGVAAARPAVPPAAPPGAAAAAAVDVVLLENLERTATPADTLQLQDAWGNAWRAAAAALTAGGANDGEGPDGAAAAPEQQQQQQQLGGSQQSDQVAGIWETPQRSFLAAILAEPVGETEGPPAKRQRTSPAAAPQQPGSGGSRSGRTPPSEVWQLLLLLVKSPLRHNSADGGAGSSGGGAEQQQQVACLDFDNDGAVRLASRSLASLGISTAGDYKLLAVAVAGKAAAGGGGGTSSSSAAGQRELPPVLLGHYRVSPQDRYTLVTRQTQLTQAIKQLKTDVSNRRSEAAGLQQQQEQITLQLNDSRLQHANAAARRDALREQVGGLQGLLENSPAQLLPRINAAGGRSAALVPQLLLHSRTAMQQAGGAALQPVPQPAVNRLLGSTEVQQLHEAGGAGGGAVLGPMVCLGAAERSDVARVLAAYIGQSELASLVCRNRQGTDAAHRARVEGLNLGQPELVQSYAYVPHLHHPHPVQRQQTQQQVAGRANPDAWYYTHPQQLVPPAQDVQELLGGVLNWAAYSPEQGFVGFAINLVRLSPRQLDTHIQVQGVLNGRRLRYDGRVAPLLLGLRHTVWQLKLANVLVFEGKAHIDAFMHRLHSADGGRGRTLPPYVRVVGLDGSTYNVRRGHDHHMLQLPGPGGLLFAGVSQEEVLPPPGRAGGPQHPGPLDLRLRHLAELKQRQREAEALAAEHRQEVAALESQLRGVQGQLGQLQTHLAADEAADSQRTRQLAADLEQVQQELAEFGADG